jgi:hypothetical protein
MVMSLKTQTDRASFPRAEEENNESGGAENGGRERDPVQGRDHQA